MTSKIIWFTVRLALIGLQLERVPEIVQALRHELGMRPHLRDPRVDWDAPGNRIIVQADTEDLNARTAAEQIREEMMEALAAVLWETEGTRFEILESSICLSK